jgi:PKD repeat protein
MNRLSYYLVLLLLIGATAFSRSFPLKRGPVTKPTYTELPSYLNTDRIVLKLKETANRPELVAGKFDKTGGEWDRLNALVTSPRTKSAAVRPRIDVSRAELDKIRAEGASRTGIPLPDLSLYYEMDLDAAAAASEKLATINDLNSLDIVEIAYFAPIPSLPTNPPEKAPDWQPDQNHLQAAPAGIDAYYAWDYAGGRGENIKVTDIEGNWVFSHEDLRGGAGGYHIAGGLILDPTWYQHGTAVLGEIAADSNASGMTGIAYNVDLGTVSIGSMSTSSALTTAMNNCDTGDVILIELQYDGPNNGAYVPVEYFQDEFDAILTASAAGRIVVEAGANGGQDLDDTFWYGSLFDPDYRFSGAILVGAADPWHNPLGFSSYGQRLDVHGFGSDVYTLGYGDLYGSDTTNQYTAQFSGTSSASPIIVGACAVLQGIHKNAYGRVLDHAEMRDLLTTFSTPQNNPTHKIGPMPDLQGSVDQVVGVSFVGDTLFGWVPYDVSFTGNSALAVDTWSWDFGDGEISSLQSPVHTYQAPGWYDVSLQVDAAGDIRSLTKHKYVIALADSMIATDTSSVPNTEVEMTIRARNAVPVQYIEIPVARTGDFIPVYDSFSVAGCRTSNFGTKGIIHLDPFNNRFTFRLLSSTDGSIPDMQPGEGPILKLYFTVPESAQSEDTSFIDISGYSTHTPKFYGSVVDYEPVTVGGKLIAGGCLFRGDLDDSQSITIADLTQLVSYMFKSGPAPNPVELADVDCNDSNDIGDVTYLVTYMFRSGPPPCGCASQ